MQTFLTHPSMVRTAETLDSKRLNKQLLEGRQILATIKDPTRGWAHHPAVLMWKDNPLFLGLYLEAIKNECVKRGIKTDTNWTVIKYILHSFKYSVPPPSWFSDEKLLSRMMITHRANLFFKNSTHYSQFEPESAIYRNYVCCKRCNYFWPTHVAEER